jgi:hypothetical protein
MTAFQRGAITKITEIGDAIVQIEFRQSGIVGPGKYLIKNVIVPFAFDLRRDARLFQEVVRYGRPHDGAGLGVEGNFDEFPEAGRIVVF